MEFSHIHTPLSNLLVGRGWQIASDKYFLRTSGRSIPLSTAGCKKTVAIILNFFYQFHLRWTFWSTENICFLNWRSCETQFCSKVWQNVVGWKDDVFKYIYIDFGPLSWHSYTPPILEFDWSLTQEMTIRRGIPLLPRLPCLSHEASAVLSPT